MCTKLRSVSAAETDSCNTFNALKNARKRFRSIAVQASLRADL